MVYELTPEEIKQIPFPFRFQNTQYQQNTYVEHKNHNIFALLFHGDNREQFKDKETPNIWSVTTRYLNSDKYSYFFFKTLKEAVDYILYFIDKQNLAHINETISIDL